MDFKNYFCPVCKKQFTDDDDVVVCPDCGTPHHRECYNEIGKCFNENSHNSGIAVDSTFKSTDTVQEENGSVLTEETVSQIEEKDEKKSLLDDIPDIIKIKPAQNALIEGKHAHLFELAVGNNQKYYIPRFMLMSDLKKGISWNFFAFLVPLAWSLYRKMYKFSAIILAIYLLVFGLTGYYITTNEEFTSASEACMQEDVNYMSNILLYESGSGDVTLTANQQKLIEAINNLDLSIPAYVRILSFLPFAFRIYSGLFANKNYLKKLKKSIEKAEKKGLQGDDLSKYIYRKNGTLPMILVVLLGIFEFLTIYN